MQYCSVFVKCYNVVVRYVGIMMIGCGQIGNVDIELVYVRMERFFCCMMIVDCYFLCFTYIGQFVFGFEGVIVMQVVDNFFWVDVVGFNIQLQCMFWYWIDIIDIVVCSGQQVINVIGFWQCDYFYIFSLEGGWQWFDVVLVINWQIELQFWFVYVIYQ